VDLTVALCQRDGRLLGLALSEHHDAVIETDAKKMCCDRIELKEIVLIGIPGMHPIDSPVGEFHEARLVAVSAITAGLLQGMAIFDRVNAVIVDRRPQRLERGDLMLVYMAASSRMMSKGPCCSITA
jgi:hypothetical protein